MEPHDDGQQIIIISTFATFVPISETRREDVEVEAVLSAEDEEVLLREDDVALYAGRALAAETGEPATAVLHAIPTLGFLWQRKPGEKSNGQVRTRKNMTAVRMEITANLLWVASRKVSHGTRSRGFSTLSFCSGDR